MGARYLRRRSSYSGSPESPGRALDYRRRVPTTFSVISPMYNVEAYLPDFFASLREQSYGFERLEVILVDDGSTDGTLAVAEEFAATRPNVTVLTQSNGGQASARNLGLAHATGTWLTFPDPDDVLSPGYFAAAAAEIERHAEGQLAMVSARILMWFEDRDSLLDNHALAGRFRHGRRVADLDAEPEWIQPHITSGFVRRDVVSAAGLRFPEDLRLRFEDANFVARYLLHCPRPAVAFLPSAQYHYRQRADSSSTMQSSHEKPEKYTDTIRIGFGGVIAEAESLGRPLPRWAQNLFLYDQFWILRSSQTARVRQSDFPEEMHRELAESVPGFLRHIDEEAISNFALMTVAPWMREALLLVKRGRAAGTVYRGAVDRRRGLQSVVYRYHGERPVERLSVDGAVVAPRFEKTQPLEYVGRPLVWQRTLWIPEPGAVEVTLDGEPREIEERPTVPLSPFAARGRLRGRTAADLRRLRKRVGSAIRRRLSGQLVSLLRRDLAVRSPRLARRFAGAWVFIDREVDANDSAEDLYWWVREHHPEVNAWFVVRAGTPDWHRLAARGARLVAYGSPEFTALLVHADHLASSHADRFITHALPRKYRPAGYSFTFLQHGVIKGDLSLWLNPKVIDVFVTSTQAEYDYIAGVSPYRYSTKEVRLTGLPRFDVLRELDAAVNESERDIVLVMPTWRNYLVSDLKSASDDRELLGALAETEYGRALATLLRDPELERLQEAGARIVFMPHPNMQRYLPQFDLPPHIEIVSYLDADVRDMIVRAAVLVTDYSSTAFNAAYLRRPVIYYQFDQEEYRRGHTERAGYFDYERDGFGPVLTEPTAVVEMIARAIAGDFPAEYTARTDAAFPVRDGNNRARTFDAMREVRTRRSLQERSRPAPPDSWSVAPG